MNIDYIENEIKELEEIKFKAEKDKENNKIYINITNDDNDIDIIDGIKFELINLTITKYKEKLEQLTQEFEKL